MVVVVMFFCQHRINRHHHYYYHHHYHHRRRRHRHRRRRNLMVFASRHRHHLRRNRPTNGFIFNAPETIPFIFRQALDAQYHLSRPYFVLGYESESTDIQGIDASHLHA